VFLLRLRKLCSRHLTIDLQLYTPQHRKAMEMLADEVAALRNELARSEQELNTVKKSAGNLRAARDEKRQLLEEFRMYVLQRFVTPFSDTLHA
jgi:hypothetical protein